MDNKYIYEMGKLYDRKGKEYFDLMLYSVLKSQWKNNEDLLKELENMKGNLGDELANIAEYYRSYGRIEKILGIDDL